MTREIEVDQHWVPKIQKLAIKFNRYANKRSLSNVAETLDKIVQLMKNELGDTRTHAAEALSRIRMFNRMLITQYTSNLIDQCLAESGQMTFTQPDYVDYSTAHYESNSNYNSNPQYSSNLPDNSYSTPPTTTYINIGSSNNSSDYSGERYGTEPNNNKNEEYEEWDEDEDSEDITDDLMELPVEKLNIKNIKKVYMREEFIKRKCALGDGEFGDYEGNLYECTCGTLYHETCLKVQALYTGICAICDREFLKKE